MRDDENGLCHSISHLIYCVDDDCERIKEVKAYQEGNMAFKVEFLKYES